MSKIAFLSISTYRADGHFYGRLHIRENGERDNIDVYYKPSSIEAKKLSGPDYQHKTGELTIRFFDKKNLIKSAIQTFKNKLPDYSILALSDEYPSHIFFESPYEILYGPKSFMTKANKLYLQIKTSDWHKQMNEIDKAWKELCLQEGVKID